MTFHKQRGILKVAHTKRVFDVVLSVILLVVLAIPMLFIALVTKIGSGGAVVYWSERVGKNGATFNMPKFRSMRAGLPAGVGHWAAESEFFLLPTGRFIRRTSLDELPQLFSILKGDMSFVGPRPIVPHQEDFIALREAYGVHRILPGLTGWAQVNGRNAISVAEKVALDVEYMRKQSFWFDLKIMCLTLGRVIRQEGVSHRGAGEPRDAPRR